MYARAAGLLCLIGLSASHLKSSLSLLTFKRLNVRTFWLNAGRKDHETYL